jgi:hypothetical protein
LRLLEDPALRRQIGTAGYNYAHDQHDWRQITLQLEGIYNEIINNPHSDPI